MGNKKTLIILLFIFVLSLSVRFMYYPENVYFGYDQARDAYISQEIYRNKDIKIVGPSSSHPELFHGPLYWYLIGPFYLLGSGNPIVPAGFLLIINALGVFTVFCLGFVLFNSTVGLLAALLYAISFEQTQYSLYFGNPAPAVLTMMLFYLGLAIFLFKKKWWGIPFSLFGLGLSIHFEFFLMYQSLSFLLVLVIYKKPEVFNLKILLTGIGALFTSLITFFLAELKFEFRTTKTLLNVVNKTTESVSREGALRVYAERFITHIEHNVFGLSRFMSWSILALLFITLIYFIWKKKNKRILFLSIWFLSTLFFLIFGLPSMYYADIGIAPALTLLVGYFVSLLLKNQKWLAYACLAAILTSNLILISRQNKNGIINDIYVQEGMLLTREKKAIDYIYSSSQDKPIVVSALTMPLNVNTTWSYLFNWYGKSRYKSVPYWAGLAAEGYPGSLPQWKSQEKEYAAFTIIEPVRGVRQGFIDSFLQEQDQYGEKTDEEIWGSLWYSQLVVQRRK